jgi:hypothetical protein
MRCDQCKWWDGEPNPRRYPEGWKECNSPRLARGYAIAIDPDAKAIVENDEGWSIATAPDFGCVIFEAK